mmetsp:Transcript_26923/g.30025  ORF Transcript_26923/g.30025 Transcript_26923/m.30025 type:complete len:134 (+) Transcript_26923:584-985(+)
MTIMYKLGITQERKGFYRVVDHNMFMFAILLLTGSKPSKVKSEYHRYKAMTRWIKVYGKRKQYRQWTFTLRNDRASDWNRAYRSIVETITFSNCEPILGYRSGEHVYHFSEPQGLGSQSVKTLIRKFSRTGYW